MSTSRLESFSDGVIAVAITLLVLGITVPTGHQHRLVYYLGQLWPAYAAYVVSFLTIGIIWINHHVMIARLRETDHSILILNILLLMSIGILPFATQLMASYLNSSSGESLAAAIYAGSLLLMSVAFATLNHHILIKRAHMLTAELDLGERRRILLRSISGLVPYVVATIVSVLSPYATIAICGAVAVFYSLPVASGLGRRA